MENNATAPVTTQSSSTATTQNRVETKEKLENKEEKKNEVIKKTFEQLVNELNGITNDTDLWYLTYMLDNPEVYKNKTLKDNIISVSMTALCKSSNSFSRLEEVSRCVAERQKGYDNYKHSFTFNLKNVKSKCTECTENYDFCPHKMASYIDHVCSGNGIERENVYRVVLGDAYKKKEEFKSFKELNIHHQDYEFIDAVSATAAAELIKLRLINVTDSAGDRVVYSYVPCCEKSKRSVITPIYDFYRIKNGKNDFLYKNALKENVCENRNCAECIFPQCPDKVAAFILYLSDRYNVDPLELCEFIINKNKIAGVTLRGNFRYYNNLRKLDAIPFTPESRVVLNNIVRYVVNKFTVSKNVPLIPFNLTIYTKDENLADETVATFKDFLYYYCYFSDDKLPLVEYKFSEGGLEGLIKKVGAIDKPTVIHVKEMGLLSAVMSNATTNAGTITMQMSKLVNLVNDNHKNVCMVISGEKQKLDLALAQYSDFYDGTLSYKLTISDMSAVKIVGEILKELKEKYELEEGFESALEYYVLSKYGESTLKSRAFIQWVKETIIFNHYNKEINTESKLLIKDIPAAANRRSDEEIWAELNSLTGLENVKDEIRSIEQLLKFQKKMQNIGVKGGSRPNMHMVFAGNPGTGKTTVARLISEILYNVGFIKQNKLIEVSSKDLIGKFIGHTAPKTAAVCESAYGGVLFIDEAYELAVKDNSGSANFRSECIAELIKQMEDNRDRLIVIFAGYSKEMQELLDSNPGFASRIGRTIEFEDYSTEQLSDMFVRLIYKNGLRISEDAKEKVAQTVESARSMPNFGNARYVRNLYENVVMEHAKNMIEVDDPDVLVEIQDSDIVM